MIGTLSHTRYGLSCFIAQIAFSLTTFGHRLSIHPAVINNISPVDNNIFCCQHMSTKLGIVDRDVWAQRLLGQYRVFEYVQTSLSEPQLSTPVHAVVIDHEPTQQQVAFFLPGAWQV